MLAVYADIAFQAPMQELFNVILMREHLPTSARSIRYCSEVFIIVSAWFGCTPLNPEDK